MYPPPPHMPHDAVSLSSLSMTVYVLVYALRQTA